MTVDVTDKKTPETLPFRLVVQDELAAVQKDRSDLMIPRGYTGLHLIVLIACVLVNIAFFLSRFDYFGLFIAASFYLNMYYFITLILPTNFEKSRVPAADLSRLRVWLKEIGVKNGTSQFTRLFINSLFINNRGLSLGIGLIFSIDIVFALADYAGGILPLRTTAIVVTQCGIIVIFYLLIWKMEPFSTTYIKKVEQAKSHLHQRNLPPQMVTGIFLFGFMLAIFLFLTTIIYLPGVTVNAFLNQSELTGLGHLVSLLALLAISQYFIIRFIHGITSRTMAERLFDFKLQSLQDLLDAEDTTQTGDPGPGQSHLEKSSLLLESKIFIVKRSTIAGTFAVFIVDLDFSVLMDTTTLTAIRGYIVEKP